ncbi:hypothetical protein GQ43DRAFT_288780 [Delitschia confertaspora ATCC 74209]|uniref:Uncharacterized protein n=1 Tax=Delitschia confertaspora ATCC 74209 TaxID=1513339 RepID=A0A9P4JRI9_9PLEO|nr:hypothetical protein GQ43DRAFT_288780 [Delitschia confertaspora ATCC 74209]
MASERPQLSITLPRNFTFHYEEGQLPKTPEPDSQPEEMEPPKPPRQTYKVRRRRTAFDFSDAAALDASLSFDHPIPTIEAPDYLADQELDLPYPSPDQIDGLLAPAATFGRMYSPPKTPEAQIMKALDNYCGELQPWANMERPNATASRPASSCSGISDSSTSSRGSFGSYPSYGDNLTSPEEEMADPFIYYATDNKYKFAESPIQTRQQPAAKQYKTRTAWTDDLDRHLWMTYNMYLQDPTVTPFKVPPGMVPPNGVCHRVARMATKTWKGPRSLSVTISSLQRQARLGTPDTLKPSNSGNSTPVPRRPYSRFPSQAEARKRLRYLCKHQLSLSTHYQRLINSKSVSPERSSPPAEENPSRLNLSSPFPGETASFSTRDMNVSLATSTAASMQFGNPLSQLANDGTPRAAPQQNDWSHMRSAAHQKSQSLHIGLGIGNMFGSAFAAMSQMTGQSLGQHAAAQTWHAQGNHPRLDPPLELHSPMPLPRPFKRRALHKFDDQLENSGVNLINQLFGAPAEISHRRVRSRGFSLGDVEDGARQLSSMFSPPASSSSTSQTSFEHLSAAWHGDQDETPPGMAHGQPTIRLGSPFGGRSSNFQFNKTFPRTTTSYGFEAPASFEQRFAGLSSDPDHLA